ncbi:MAG: DUF6179 domain-containing protein [Clostridium sp.]
MKDIIISNGENFEKQLSNEQYFQSLLQVIHSNGILDLREFELLQFQLLEVITETIGYFTRGESSSVREEVAEQIMLSINYTIGLALKKETAVKESIDLIKKEGMKYLFTEGEKILKHKVKECKRLYNLAKETRIETENYGYVDTINYGIPLFFKSYNTRFACHEIPGSIDYPLSVEEIDFVGIEYIEEYLNILILENKFCSYFDIAEIEALLKGFNKNSKHILINIYMLVLTNYLGCTIAGNRGVSLNISKGDREYLKSIMEPLSQVELHKLIFSASEKICEELLIENKNLIEFINNTASKIADEIKINIDTDTLEKVFITLSTSEENMIKFEDRKTISNSRFRIITEEIRACSEVEDKIKIIREEISSLKDLMDVLGADCIFDEEFFQVFKALDDFEIALILKTININEVLDNYYGTESEKYWHEKFKVYVESLEPRKKEKITNMAESIEM